MAATDDCTNTMFNFYDFFLSVQLVKKLNLTQMNSKMYCIFIMHVGGNFTCQIDLYNNNIK